MQNGPKSFKHAASTYLTRCTLKGPLPTLTYLLCLQEAFQDAAFAFQGAFLLHAKSIKSTRAVTDCT
jgi:hypothetical protein